MSDDTIRKVVNYIGGIVFDEDCHVAKECEADLNSRVRNASYSKRGVLYLQIDGAALNTRTKDQNDSTWRENKLGLAFSSDHIHYWKNAKGQMQHRILRREYIPYIGSAQEFKYHLYALAIRAGYGEYEKTVILSDGATWIRMIKNELFPDAQQILDLSHLKENTYEFAKQLFGDHKEKYVRWNVPTAQCMLSLKAKMESDQWVSVVVPLINRLMKQPVITLH